MADQTAEPQPVLARLPRSPWTRRQMVAGVLGGIALATVVLLLIGISGVLPEGPNVFSELLWSVGAFGALLFPLWFFTLRQSGDKRDLFLGRFPAGAVFFAVLGALPFAFFQGWLWSAIASVWDVPTSQEYWWGTDRAFTTAELLALTVSVVVVGPIAEELVFRGFLLRYFGGFMKPVAAIAVVSLIFAVYHFQPPGIPLRFTFGMAAGMLALGTRSLYPAIGFHMANNALSLMSLAATTEG